MERGAALEPENAAAWDRLGRARETDFVNPDPKRAVADFQKAVARVPLSAAYWMDLASAYESTGNIPLAREAFNRARAAYPASALVAWSYGNFLLRQGDDASGFAQINHAVQADPSLAMPAVSQAWHKTQDANVLLNQVLPATQDACFQAIDFMAANGQPAGALVIWERLLTLGKPVVLRRSFPLFEFLIQSYRAEEAPSVERSAICGRASHETNRVRSIDDSLRRERIEIARFRESDRRSHRAHISWVGLRPEPRPTRVVAHEPSPVSLRCDKHLGVDSVRATSRRDRLWRGGACGGRAADDRQHGGGFAERDHRFARFSQRARRRDLQGRNRDDLFHSSRAHG
jgi:hypothetical protein